MTLCLWLLKSSHRICWSSTHRLFPFHATPLFWYPYSCSFPMPFPFLISLAMFLSPFLVLFLIIIFFNHSHLWYPISFLEWFHHKITVYRFSLSRFAIKSEFSFPFLKYNHMIFMYIFMYASPSLIPPYVPSASCY